MQVNHEGLARSNRHAMLAVMEEENQDVGCVDDITGKELECTAKSMNVKPLRSTSSPPIDTKWIDIVKAFDGRAKQLCWSIMRWSV